MAAAIGLCGATPSYAQPLRRGEVHRTPTTSRATSREPDLPAPLPLHLHVVLGPEPNALDTAAQTTPVTFRVGTAQPGVRDPEPTLAHWHFVTPANGSVTVVPDLLREAAVAPPSARSRVVPPSTARLAAQLQQPPAPQPAASATSVPLLVAGLVSSAVGVALLVGGLSAPEVDCLANALTAGCEIAAVGAVGVLVGLGLTTYAAVSMLTGHGGAVGARTSAPAPSQGGQPATPRPAPVEFQDGALRF